MNAKSAIPPIPREEIQRLLASSAPTISPYAASIYLGDDWVSSGVYAKCLGYKGILTAGHCASDFLAAEQFGLLVSESKHELWVGPASFEHVTIGCDDTEGYSLDGPDLSFAIIRDDNLLNILYSQKHDFYDLGNHEITAVFSNPIPKFNWSVAGNPSEDIQVTRELVKGEEYRMLNTTMCVMQGNLVSIIERNGFDYISLRLISGLEGFPTCYNGVSGGGIWYHRFVTKDEIAYKVEPILAGIVCWQSERANKGGYKERRISGHGYDSIYGQVPRVLAQKRAGQ